MSEDEQSRDVQAPPGDARGAEANTGAGAPGSDTGEQGDEAARKRRRRGRRGGRRHKSASAQAEAADAAGAGQSGAPAAGGGASPAASAAGVQAPPAAEVGGQAQARGRADAGPGPEAKAGADGAPTETKRRRGRRRKAAPETSAPAVAETNAAAVAGGAPAPPLAAGQLKTSTDGHTQPAAESAGQPAAEAAGDEKQEALQRKARRRRRGGRGRGKGAVAGTASPAAAGTAESAAAEVIAPEPAAAASAAKPGRRPSRRHRPATAPPDTGVSEPAGPATRASAGEVLVGQRMAAAVGHGEELTVAAPELGVSGAETGETGGQPAPKGRRRGGRKRRGKGGEAAAAADAAADSAAEQAAPYTLLTGAQARAEALGVELPKRKRILVSSERNELRVAVVEDDRLAEILIERPNKRSYLGNIYKGKVDNVLGGMDAAFVDFGLEKNGFLYVDEVALDDEDRKGRKITSLLHPGQEILCQVIKDPMGSKGARLTMKLSLAGRYVVYVVGGSGVGVSRRLPAAERERLRELCKSLRVRNAGLIVRTAAEGKGVDELHADTQYLSRLWSRLKAKIDKLKAPGLLYAEVDVALETVRDLFNESCESVIVDSERQLKEIVSFLDKVAPHLEDRVRLYTDPEPLFEAYGIESQIADALERRVSLPSGGNLVIDHTEALTVIDVNSGRYTGGKGLEETITKTNLEAAREVVRQLRLRDIGGIIIIDFIDMSYARNREAVLKRLEGELETDRTKTYVVELSPLGLVEMTRQNTTDGARGILTKTCPYCQGKARIVSEETMALTVQRRLRDLGRTSQAKAFLIEINRAVAERVAADGELRQLEKEIGKRVFFEGSASLPIDTFHVVCEGTPAEVEAQRIPLREGQELEAEFEHALTYSPRDAVAYVDGYMVIVDGGRPFLGHRRRIKVVTANRTAAFANLVGAGKGQ